MSHRYVDSVVRLVIVVMLVAPITVYAEAEPESDWGFDVVAVWSWRDLEGTMFSVNPPFAGGGTAESMGLGSASNPQFSVGMRWKRLHVDLVYLPSEFSGSGEIVQGVDIGNGNPISKTTSITSDIGVAMTLANAEYDLLARKDMEWGVGAGLGQVALDIQMQPETGKGVDIKSTVPFGYLTTSLTKRWNKFALGATVQGLSLSQGYVDMSYKSANIAGGYTVFQRGRMNASVIGGYRYVSFKYDFDDDTTGVRSSTDFELTGPYIGFRLGW